MHESLREFERPEWTDEERRNVDVVLRALESIKNEMDTIADLYADEVTHYFLGAGTEPMVWTSDTVGWEEYQAEMRAAFPDWTVTVEHVVADDDVVIAQVTVDATLEREYRGMVPTGESFSVPAFYMMRLVDGKIVEQKSLMSTIGMLQQLGLFPDSPGKMAKLVAGQLRRKLGGGRST